MRKTLEIELAGLVKHPAWLACFVLAVLSAAQTIELGAVAERTLRLRQRLETAETRLRAAEAEIALERKNRRPRTEAPKLQEPQGGVTLAQKNKNPLNVKSMPHAVWEGQVATDRHGHAVFSSWEYGIRAASLTLRSYARRHSIDTVEAVVQRFAKTATPENKARYTGFLARRLNVGPREKINLIERMPELLRHMAKYESGLDLPARYFAPYDILAKL